MRAIRGFLGATIALAPLMAWGAPTGGPAALKRELAPRAAELRQRWPLQMARDAKEPRVLRGHILTPTVDVSVAPGAGAIELLLDPGAVGIDHVSFEFQSPSGDHFIKGGGMLPAYPPQTGRIRLPFQTDSFGLYAEPGNWMLVYLLVLSRDGTITEYTSQQLISLFPYTGMVVANPGTPDTQPPVAISGAILTPTVSLGGAVPYFAARIKAFDKVSGLASAALSIVPPEGTIPIWAEGALTAPLHVGTVIVSAMLPATLPTGTYTITASTLCDAAANCVTDDSAADIQALLGTTTFQVTN